MFTCIGRKSQALYHDLQIIITLNEDFQTSMGDSTSNDKITKNIRNVHNSCYRSRMPAYRIIDKYTIYNNNMTCGVLYEVKRPQNVRHNVSQPSLKIVWVNYY